MPPDQPPIALIGRCGWMKSGSLIPCPAALLHIAVRHAVADRDGCAVLVEYVYYAGTDDGGPAVESQAIDRALCSLGEQDRELLRLDAFGDSAKEIGEKLGLTAENVRQRKSRVLAGLRKQLKLH